MIVYSAKIRLSGQVANEVFKSNLTAAEIIVLRHLHGDDAVLDIRRIGKVKRSNEAERTRLAGEYRNGKGILDDGEKLVVSIFGVTGVPLPVEYKAPAPLEDSEPIEVDLTSEDIELDDHPSEPVVRTVVKSKKDAAEALVA